MKTPTALIVLCCAALAGCASTDVSTRRADPAPLAAALPSTSEVKSIAQPTVLAPSSDPASAPVSATQAFQTELVTRRAVVPLAPAADIWERIRRGFAMPDLNNEIVRSQEQWYSARPDYITRMTQRSEKYMFHIVEELERRGMPAELALLPFIESAFNPQAVSSAKAAGMWQFIPSTGRHFDLKQNVFRDDRRDVLASTRAALDYLHKLHSMFGDWHLALAAYNWGEGSVGRALANNRRLGLGLSYADLNMPNETRQYVPKLQAVKNIVSDPARFAARLPSIDDHPYFQSVDIKRDIDVELAARLAQVRVEDFRSLNPSANKPLIMAAGTPQILLPWDNAEIFMRNLSTYTGQLASWTVWTAQTTYKTAQAAQRVGMSETEFRQLNGIPVGMLIKPGSTLLVPRAAQVQADVSEKVADSGQVNLVPELVLKKTAVRARKGETVASLARRYNISAAQVAQWNGLSALASLSAGRSLVLYLPSRVRSSATGPRRAATAVSTPSRQVARSAPRSVRTAKR